MSNDLALHTSLASATSSQIARFTCAAGGGVGGRLQAATRRAGGGRRDGRGGHYRLLARAHAWCAWCGAHGTRTSLSSSSPIALDWSVRKAAAPLSLSVLSLIASVSPVRKVLQRLSRRKRGTEAADTSSPFAAMAASRSRRRVSKRRTQIEKESSAERDCPATQEGTAALDLASA